MSSFRSCPLSLSKQTTILKHSEEVCPCPEADCKCQNQSSEYNICDLPLQLIPQISSLTPITTLLPLVGVLSLTALKDGYDEVVRAASLEHGQFMMVINDHHQTGPCTCGDFRCRGSELPISARGYTEFPTTTRTADMSFQRWMSLDSGVKSQQIDRMIHDS